MSTSNNNSTLDYYALLGVHPDADSNTLREAYIREALVWHPDRNPSSQATTRFQEIGEAYFVLSDPQRRQSYDAARRNKTPFTFTTSPSTPTNPSTRADDVFNGVFEELLRPEVAHPMPFWRVLGGGSGTILGFIFANIPGMFIGGIMGYRMGQIRDNKGVSVMEAFSRLPREQKAQLLAGLAKKFIGVGI